MRTPKKHDGFTLVELLAVIAIIGLLIGVSVPSLHRITQASALSNGTRQFSDQVAMARTYALVNAKTVYLVVAYKDTYAANTTLSNTYCYTAYGFCVSAVSPFKSAMSQPSPFHFPPVPIRQPRSGACRSTSSARSHPLPVRRSFS